MRLTNNFCRQHLDRMFARHWKVQGQRSVVEVNAAKEIADRGIPIYDAKNILKGNMEKKVKNGVLKGRHDSDNQPLFNTKVCHVYRDHNVLLEGLDQAKVITKSVEIHAGLPQGLIEVANSKLVQDKLVQRCIVSSHLLDAIQVKLPRLHDASRPAWKFPRVMGISDYRKSQLLTSRLLQLCESMTGGGKNRFVIKNCGVSVPVEKDSDLIQFQLVADFLLLSPLELPTQEHNVNDISLPDITPINHTITLEKEHFYELNNFFPLVDKSMMVHTAFFLYDSSGVANIFETPVSESQIFGRTLMKSFAVAASQACHKFGNDCLDLPKPMLLQSIHTDGKFFQFAIFQLNTLNLNGFNGNKNILWISPRLQLYTSCTYNKGKPVFQGYNPEVFKYVLAFYCNGLEFVL